MLRTSASNLLRKSLVRSTPALASRAASTHAISNPTLANIEKRWEGMPLQEQAELWMALRDRMQSNWTELTLQEKKAGASQTLLHCENTSIPPRVAEILGHNHHNTSQHTLQPYQPLTIHLTTPQLHSFSLALDPPGASIASCRT
jgi:hypothetical protein